MLKQLFDKLLCKHKWKTHTKEVYEWTQHEVDPTTQFWIQPVVNTYDYKETTEILICEHCGKIKKLVY